MRGGSGGAAPGQAAAAAGAIRAALGDHGDELDAFLEAFEVPLTTVATPGTPAVARGEYAKLIEIANADATYANVCLAILGIARLAVEGDLVTMMFATHFIAGRKLEGHQENFLCLCDEEFTEIELLVLLKLFAPGVRFNLLFDCCESGTWLDPRHMTGKDEWGDIDVTPELLARRTVDYIGDRLKDPADSNLWWRLTCSCVDKRDLCAAPHGDYIPFDEQNPRHQKAVMTFLPRYGHYGSAALKRAYRRHWVFRT